MVFVDAELEQLLEDVDEGVEIVRIDDTGEAGDPYEDYLAEGSPEAVPSVLEDEEETISINYTSGTTGRPKGVMYTHRGAYLSALGNVVETAWATRPGTCGRSRCSTATGGPIPGPSRPWRRRTSA